LNLKISHLVVNGCSFTYGHGMEDPLKEAWPSILAKRLGVPLVNLAIPGQGNTAIYRRTMQYFYKDLFNDNNPFYIHAYTQSSRREAYCGDADKLLDCIQQFFIVDGSHNTVLEKEIILNSDDHYYNLLEQNKLHLWASINSLLDANNVPHLMSDYMQQTTGEVHEFIEKHEQILKNELDIHFGKLQNFSQVTSHIDKLPCHHETVEGNSYLADYIWKEIEKRYDEIEVIDLPHAKLDDIVIHTPFSSKNVQKVNDGLLAGHSDVSLDYYPLAFARNVYYMHELGLDYLNRGWAGKPNTPRKP
jgi:hypothetical protein